MGKVNIPRLIFKDRYRKHLLEYKELSCWLAIKCQFAQEDGDVGHSEVIPTSNF